MSELGDLLELLHGAKDRYHSLRSTWRTWQHEERLHEAFVTESQRDGATLYAVGHADKEPPPPECESITRFWLQRPDRMREENDDVLGYSQLAIQVGSTWWAYSPQQGAMTNGGDESQGHGIGQRLEPLLDPAQLLATLAFDVHGSAERAGRNVVRVLARPRAIARDRLLRFGLLTLGTGADEYELAIDAERGVILRAEARLQGTPFSVIEAVDIGFDEPLDPQLFVFTAPAGEELHQIDFREQFRPHIAPYEAAKAVDFTVYLPARVPTDWNLHASLYAGSERPPSSPHVTLWYRSDDAAANLTVGQTAAAGADPGFEVSLEEGEEVQRNGLTMRVRPRTGRSPRAQLSMTLGETFITMNSDTLTADDLIELACSLTAASDQPPRI